MQSDWKKERYKKQVKELCFTLFILITIFFLLLISFFYYGQIKEIKINDDNNFKYKTELELFLQGYLSNLNILNKNILFFSKKDLEIKVITQFPIISKVRSYRSFSKTLKLDIETQAPFFFSCNQDFVLECAIANKEGVYYQEYDQNQNSQFIEIEVDKSNLIGDNEDSFIDNRLLSEDKYKLLLELKKFFDKISVVNKININNLEIVKFYLPDFFNNSKNFFITINLNKTFLETINDYETLEKSIEFGKVLKNKNSNLQYLDLSYKNKVFYK